MKISLIAAHDNNKAIGKNGGLPWHLPDDLKWFKAKTVNKMVVMGRNTWESLEVQPLPRRTNIVMTSQKDYKAHQAVICHSLQEVLTIAMVKEIDELMITGGGEIYQLFYPLADELIITHVDTNVDNADAYFVDYRKKYWHSVFEEKHSKDERHNYNFTFRIWKRIVKA